GLRMDARIAIHFRCRCLQDAGPQAFGQPQHVDGAVHARLRRLHGIVLVVNGRGRAGEVVDLVDLDIERKRHVVTHELEVVVIEQMLDIALRAGEEIIDANDVGAIREQTIAEVRAEETGASGNQYERFKMHVPQFLNYASQYEPSPGRLPKSP